MQKKQNPNIKRKVSYCLRCKEKINMYTSNNSNSGIQKYTWRNTQRFPKCKGAQPSTTVNTKTTKSHSQKIRDIYIKHSLNIIKV